MTQGRSVLKQWDGKQIVAEAPIYAGGTVDSPQTHMGHNPMDAVDYWNTTGRYHGAKSPAVRQWMLDPNNYRFEYGPLNSSWGVATRSRYLPPAVP